MTENEGTRGPAELIIGLMWEGEPDTRVAMYVTEETCEGLREIFTEIHHSAGDCHDVSRACAELAEFFDCAVTRAGQRALADRLGYSLPPGPEGPGLPEERGQGVGEQTDRPDAGDPV